jgi:hypothetical protein
MRRPPYALLSVVVLLGGAVAAGRATEPARTVAAPVRHETRPVEGAIAVCPELLKSGSDVATRLTAGVATPGAVTVRAATLEKFTGLGPVVLRSGNHVGTLGLRSDTAVAAVVTASGPQAGGLEVEQVSRGADGPHRGWAGLRCEAPTADSWFLGAATHTGNDAQLVLVNPYDDPALVRVELYGDKGVIDVPELDGIVLPPRGRVVRELATIAADEHRLAVHVVAREGRVAPAVRVTRRKGSTPLGVDWLPRLGQPGLKVDVPGAPEGNGQRHLFLFAPGEDAAHVRIQFTLPDEQFVPDGYDEIEVPPGRTLDLNLTKDLQVVDERTGQSSQRAVALRVLAEGAPVFATMSVENRARYLPIQEVAFVGPAPPLAGPTLVTEARNVDKMYCALLFSAPDGVARVRIQTVAREGQDTLPVVKTVTVQPGRLTVFPYSELPRDENVAVVITPEEGLAPVWVTRLINEQGGRGPLLTAQALTAQPTAGLDVPLVSADPAAALPPANRAD